ncbi:MAG: hypothetical protein IIB76_09610 [Proteobacteria bacterium]|nr:hypothetical protein [Pseudomonadota bacterium]
MKIKTFFLIFCLALQACPGGNPEDVVAENAVAKRVFPSADEILAKVYDNLYQSPANFYVDERADTPGSYTVYHVKDASASFELCTNDYYQALDWEAADNDSRRVNGYFVGSLENNRYFEFIRELSNTGDSGNNNEPTSPGFARVFKCDYVNRDNVDRNVRNGDAGDLNVIPTSAAAMQTFSEYMWQFTFFWPATKKVLESFSDETDTRYQHTLLLAFKTSQGTDQCDLIEIVDWVFSVSKNGGQMTKEFKSLYDMRARLNNGIVEKCAD